MLSLYGREVVSGREPLTERQISVEDYQRVVNKSRMNDKLDEAMSQKDCFVLNAITRPTRI